MKLNKEGKKGFTLAELLIVLAVLAVIAAVLMPTVFNSMPDENKLKFKKGYYTLKRTIDGMVNSDAYHGTGGHFGKVLEEGEEYPYKADGDDKGELYFCIQFSEMLNSVDNQCTTFTNTTGLNTVNFDTIDISGTATAPDASGNVQPSQLDNLCAGFPAADKSDVNIKTQDGIYWSLPKESFSGKAGDNQVKNLEGVYASIPSYYAVICMDVDGPNGDAPFAFGIRRDGKVIAGARAKQWLQEGTTTTVPTPEED